MKKQHIVRLTDGERKELTALIEAGRRLARKIKRARILLLADEGRKDREIAEKLRVSVPTVVRMRKRFASDGTAGGLEEKPRSGKPPWLNGTVAAHITGLAASDPPKGRKRWSLRLLAIRAVELNLVDSISHETIRGILKKAKRDQA